MGPHPNWLWEVGSWLQGNGGGGKEDLKSENRAGKVNFLLHLGTKWVLPYQKVYVLDFLTTLLKSSVTLNEVNVLIP